MSLRLSPRGNVKTCITALGISLGPGDMSQLFHSCTLQDHTPSDFDNPLFYFFPLALQFDCNVLLKEALTSQEQREGTTELAQKILAQAVLRVGLEIVVLIDPRTIFLPFSHAHTVPSWPHNTLACFRGGGQTFPSLFKLHVGNEERSARNRLKF